MQCLPILFYQYSIRAHARVHVYMLYLFVKSVSCFIFMFQLIENQTFQEMKHWHSMFHFWFQCFIFCKRIRDASIYTSKKNIAQVLFLSDIFLFPFIRQQFPVLT